MDEYLSEKEKLDQLMGWLRANTPWIVIGLACGGRVCRAERGAGRG